MRRRAVVGAVLLLLCGCDNEQVRQCESDLKGRLKSPASYSRVSVVQFTNSTYKQPYHEVDITYDAANTYGAILRNKEDCFFVPGTTQAIDPFGVIAAQAQLDALKEEDDPNAVTLPASQPRI